MAAITLFSCTNVWYDGMVRNKNQNFWKVDPCVVSEKGLYVVDLTLTVYEICADLVPWRKTIKKKKESRSLNKLKYDLKNGTFDLKCLYSAVNHESITYCWTQLPN